MEITVFAKTRKTPENRTFRTYLTRLHKKDTGEEVTVGVRFAEGIPLPSIFPCNLILDKKNANLSQRRYTTEDGEVRFSQTLWIKEYQLSDVPFVDHSLDDYE